ncbi:MAG: hypothetical protein HYZ50_08575 [Deltaproteobacteria bacterium]|nr:hypothetical protein [Deltaproteobacteria bacterium]
MPYTFGSPYERYGNPTIVPTATGVIVRYASTYTNGQWDQTTPLAPNPTPVTLGHQCWTGGDPNYPNSGCEHFGISLIGNPTKTTYRWLVADPAQAGNLTPLGSKVSIPAPVWNVVPQVNNPPIVQAVLPAEQPEVEAQCDDAQWVKVFVTESPEPPEFDHLRHLVAGDPAVPEDASETEMEWVIFQHCPNEVDELVNEGQVAEGAEIVTRRYEFYEYLGSYDPETHEALCENPVIVDTPDPNCGPADLEQGLSGVGNFIGAQMAAIDLNLDGDLDGDGVLDANDLCVSTPPGQVVDADGCSCEQKSCDDGNACTTDTCDAATATCQNVNAVVCSALGTCYDAGVCDPASGECSNPPKSEGASCDADGDACTIGQCDGAGQCGSESLVPSPPLCVPHDLAVTDIAPPKTVALTTKKPEQTKSVAVQIQNRSAHTESIDAATLQDLVSLTVQPLRAECTAPTAVLNPPKKMPLTLKAKAKATLHFDVTFDFDHVCDAQKSTKNDPNHDDFSYKAEVHHVVLDGHVDTHPDDDVCPRPALGVDPNPDNKIKDQGCDEVLTDIVKP